MGRGEGGLLFLLLLLLSLSWRSMSLLRALVLLDPPIKVWGGG